MEHLNRFMACPDEGSCLQKVMTRCGPLGTNRLANSGCHALKHPMGRVAHSLSTFDPLTVYAGWSWFAILFSREIGSQRILAVCRQPSYRMGRSSKIARTQRRVFLCKRGAPD
jgi:hypothetical protein